MPEGAVLTTDDYLKAIQAAREGSKRVAINFANLPAGVDRNKVRKELSSRLPDAYTEAIGKAYSGGAGIRLDFSKLTLEPTVLERVKGAVRELPPAVEEAAAKVKQAVETVPQRWSEMAFAVPGSVEKAVEAFRQTEAGQRLNTVFETVGDLEKDLESMKAGLLKEAERIAETDPVLGRDFEEPGKGAILARTMAESLVEMTPMTMKETIEAVAVGKGVQLGARALVQKFPMLAKQIRLPKRLTDFINHELNQTVYNIKKGLGIPQETGLVPLDIRQALAEGKLSLADAERNSEELYKEELLKRILPPEVQRGAGVPEKPPPEVSPIVEPPKAVSEAPAVAQAAPGTREVPLEASATPPRPRPKPSPGAPEAVPGPVEIPGKPVKAAEPGIEAPAAIPAEPLPAGRIIETKVAPKVAYKQEPIESSARAIQDKRSTLPVLQSFKVEKGFLQATDLTVSLSRKTDLKDGMYELAGKKLEPTSRFNTSDFPVVEPDAQVIGKLDRSELITQLERAILSKSYDETRHVLNGVLLRVRNGKGSLVATDGRMLSSSKIGVSDFRDGDYLIEGPEKVAKGLKGLSGEALTVKTTFPEDPKTQSLSTLTFSADDGFLKTRLKEGTFPNYEQVMPKPTSQVVVDSDALKKALRELEPYAARQAQGKKNMLVDLEFRPDSIVIRTPGVEIEKTVSIPAVYRKASYPKVDEGSLLMSMEWGEATPLANQVKYQLPLLQDALDGVRGPTTFLGFTDNKSPIHIFGRDLSSAPEALPKGVKAVKRTAAKTASVEKFQAWDPERPEPDRLDSRKWDIDLEKMPPLEKGKKSVETTNKVEILQFLEKSFGVPIRGKATLRFGTGEQGHYNHRTELIRLRNWGEIEVLAHEIGHRVDRSLGNTLMVGMGRWMKEAIPKADLKAVREELGALDYNPTLKRPTEGFAEYMRWRITTDQAASKAPKFHGHFNAYLDKHPDLAGQISKFKELYTVWKQQGAEERILAQIDFKGELARSRGMATRWEEFQDWWKQKWTDEFWILEKTEAELGKVSRKDVRPTQSAFEMATAFKNKSRGIARTFVETAAVDEWGNVVGPSLNAILGPIKPEQMRSFIAYATSIRALLVEGKRGLQSGFDLSDAHFIFEKYDNPVWRKVSEGLTEWADHGLQWNVRAGSLSQEEYELIRSLNPVYLPFKRVFLDEVDIASGTGTIMKQGKPIKAFRGSGRAIINPIESLMEGMAQMIARAHKTRIANLVADWTKLPGTGKHIVKVPAPLEAKKFTVEKLRGFLKELGVDETELDMDRILTIFSQSPVYRGKDNIVSIWRGGERKFYELSPELYSALTAIDPIRLGPISKLLAPFARLVRLGATGLRASFGLIRNPVRDFQTYAVYSKRNSATVFDPVLGVYKDLTRKPGDPAFRFHAAGGEVATQMGYDRAAMMMMFDEMMVKKSAFPKTLMVVKHPVDTLRKMFQVPELGPRIAELEGSMKTYRERNPSWTEEDVWIAAFNDAQDITVNFTRSGGYGRKLNEVTAFFNAAMQGWSKIYRQTRESPIQTAVKGLAWLTPTAVWQWYENKDKQWYKNLPDSYKYNNIFFETGEAIFRLPIPFELGVIFQALPVAVLDKDFSRNPKDYEGLFDMLKSQAPDIMPTVFQPAIDVAKNKDYLGRPIESEGMKYLPPTERTRQYTTGAAKSLSQALSALGGSLSPVQIDFLLNNYTGGMIRRLGVIGMREPADYPIVGDVILRSPERPRRQLEEFFQELEGLRQADNAEKTTPEEKMRLEELKKLESKLVRPTLQTIKRMGDADDFEGVKRRYEQFTLQMSAQGFQ